MTRNRRPSPFDHTQGLGSARKGMGHWWTQRVTAVALIPLTLWFAGALMAHVRSDYGAVIHWLREPVTTVLLQVVIEDYVHDDRLKIPAVIGTQLGSFALAVAGIVAVLRIAFG